MNNQKTPTMYEQIQPVRALNSVPGFEPRRYLRKMLTEDGQSVTVLDLKFRKLWFRLKYPSGRITTTVLGITEEKATFETAVFFTGQANEPNAMYTATCHNNGTNAATYIQNAQDMSVGGALNDAGFGLQFCDISQLNDTVSTGGEVKQAPPAAVAVEAASVKEAPTAAPVAAPVVTPKSAVLEKPVPVEMPVAAPIAAAIPTAMQAAPVKAPAPPVAVAEVAEQKEPIVQKSSEAPPMVEVKAEPEVTPFIAEAVTTPVMETYAEPAAAPVIAETVAPVKAVTTADVEPVHEATAVVAESAPEVAAPVVDEAPVVEEPPVTEAEVNVAAPVETVSELTQAAVAAETPAMVAEAPAESRFTPDMLFDDIYNSITVEEAGAIVVESGICKGMTLAEVAKKRIASLKFYLQAYKGEDNLLRAGAQVLYESLTQAAA